MKDKKQRKESKKEEIPQRNSLTKTIKNDICHLESFALLLKTIKVEKRLSYSKSIKPKILPFQYMKAMNKVLYKKHNCNTDNFNSIITENLIYNKNCHMVSILKDYMILDYIDEFLKRLYKLNESKERIPKIANYYKNYLKFFCNPIFKEFKINDVIQSYGDNKAELYYNRNYGNKKKPEKKQQQVNIDEHLRTIFSTTVKDKIDHNSMTQTTIKHDLDNSLNNISVNDIRMNNKPILKFNIKNNNNNSTLFNFNDNSQTSFRINKGEESILNILDDLDKESMYFDKNTKNNYYNNNYNSRATIDQVDKMIIKEFESKIIGSKPEIDLMNTVNKNNIGLSANKNKSKSSIVKNRERIKSTNYKSEEDNKNKNILNQLEGTLKYLTNKENKIKSPTNINKFINTNGNNENMVKHSPVNYTRLNEFKNLKVNKDEKKLEKLEKIDQILSSHVKNVYSTELLPNNINSLNNTPNNNYKSSHSNISNNTGNNNYNTGSSILNRLQFQSVNDIQKLLKPKSDHLISTGVNAPSVKPISNIKVNPSNGGNKSKRNNVTSSSSHNINNLLDSNNLNGRTITNGNSNNPLVNSSNGINTINDMMKITLSLCVDKTSRNRPLSQINPGASIQTANNINTINILDTGRKTTIINKVDNVNNFNINISSQINFTENPLINSDKHQHKYSGSNFSNNNHNNNNHNNHNNNNINGFNKATELNNFLEKNSRNKIQTLYKVPSNQFRTSLNNLNEDNFNINTISNMNKHNKKSSIRDSKDLREMENKIFSSYGKGKIYF
jgi:hypothetical protein